MIALTIQTIASLFTIVIGLYLAFFKSYFNEKGKNIATQEDIGKITFIVEGIKKDLLDNTERLKADLVLKNEHVISIRSVEREALINYYKEAYSMICYLQRVDFSIYSVDNFDDMYNIKINNEKKFYEFDLSQATVELFSNDVSFYEKKHDLMLAMLKLAHVVNQNSLGYRYLLHSASINLEHKTDEKSKIYSDLHQKKSEFMDKFYKERSEAYVDVIDKLIKVKNAVKSRLLEILND